MEIQSGYKTITPIQLANAVWALHEDRITHRDLRVYFGCFALVAVREAAARYRRRRGEKPRELCRHRLAELERLTGLDQRSIGTALRQLRGAGLVAFSEGEIAIPKESLPGAEQTAAVLACHRSPHRPIPVPRSVLRFLAWNPTASLNLVVIAYLLRGLSITRRTGIICAKGTVKASWIAGTFAMSQRAVKYAQAELRQRGWITKDTQSFQRKLNRDGAYFEINLAWEASRPAVNKREPEVIGGEIRNSKVEIQVCAAKDSAHREQAVSGVSTASSAPRYGVAAEFSRFSAFGTQGSTTLVHRDKSDPHIAPLPPASCTPVAPPRKDWETSYENQHQETQPAEPSAGVRPKGEGRPPSPTKPTLRNIRAEDLIQLRRLEQLHREAVAQGWISGCEAMTLNFVAAAARAREVGHDPARLFVTLVRLGLWAHITQAQEDRARRALARYREEDPARFRPSDSPPMEVRNLWNHPGRETRSAASLPRLGRAWEVGCSRSSDPVN